MRITCIIVTAADSSFYSGVDINTTRDDANFKAYCTREVNPFLAIQQSCIPVISCVHVAALTGGFELAIRVDVVLASKKLIFVITTLCVSFSRKINFNSYRY